MNDINQAKIARQELIAEYKTILRAAIDQRPSGMRQKMAQVLGTHKSFISQITNPADPTPIPARHLETIIEVCHLATGQRERFLAAYDQAHPHQLQMQQQTRSSRKTLHLQIPLLEDNHKQQALESLIYDTVRRLCDLIEDPPAK